MSWTPEQEMRMMACTTGCLAILLVVVAIVVFFAMGKPIGTLLGVTSGTGLVGIVLLLVKMIQTALGQAPAPAPQGGDHA